MLVSLPRPHRGQDIINTFKDVATFVDENGNQWIPEDIVPEYIPNCKAYPNLYKIGVAAYAHEKRPKWLFFGEEILKRNKRVRIKLRPLNPKENYQEFEAYVLDEVSGDITETEDENGSVQVNPKLQTVLDKLLTRLR